MSIPRRILAYLDGVPHWWLTEDGGKTFYRRNGNELVRTAWTHLIAESHGANDQEIFLGFPHSHRTHYQKPREHHG